MTNDHRRRLHGCRVVHSTCHDGGLVHCPCCHSLEGACHPVHVRAAVQQQVLDLSNMANKAHSSLPVFDQIQTVINCWAHLICKVPKSAHNTPLLYNLHWLPISNWIQYKIALICFHTVLHTSLGCFISTLFLTLFTQPRILRYSVFLGWAGGPWGRDSFNILDLWYETLFLSLSQAFVFILLGQN